MSTLWWVWGEGMVREAWSPLMAGAKPWCARKSHGDPAQLQILIQQLCGEGRQVLWGAPGDVAFLSRSQVSLCGWSTDHALSSKSPPCLLSAATCCFCSVILLTRKSMTLVLSDRIGVRRTRNTWLLLISPKGDGHSLEAMGAMKQRKGQGLGHKLGWGDNRPGLRGTEGFPRTQDFQC